MGDGTFQTVEITPLDFEKQVHAWLAGASKELCQFNITHRKELSGPGGEYELDAVAEFEVFGGATIVVLVECKYYRDPIKRDIVMLLDRKIREAGAHKGMIFSTSRFQSGALQYAEAHGIATIVIQDGKAVYRTKARDRSYALPPWYPRHKYVGWMISLTEDLGERYHRISDDYHDAIREWLSVDEFSK